MFGVSKCAVKTVMHCGESNDLLLHAWRNFTPHLYEHDFLAKFAAFAIKYDSRNKGICSN
jgi:hypothetical protein